MQNGLQLPSSAACLTAAYYAALFFGIGAHLPFWPVWLADWGLSEAEIGSYLALGMVVRVAGATFVPVIADRLAVRRLVLCLCGLAGCLAFLLHFVTVNRTELLIVTLAVALFLAPVIPMGEALGLRASIRHGFAYAPVRAIGSVAFLAMNLGLGLLIERMGSDVTLWVMIATTLSVAFLGLVHPGGGAPPGALSDHAHPGEARRLALSPIFMTFALALSLGQASHAVYYAYSAIDWTGRGIGAGTVGALWAFGVMVEIWLFLGSGRRLVARIGAANAMAIGAAAGLIRWGAMILAPELLWLWPLQALHALTFGLAHLGGMAFLAAAIPERLAGTAQGIASGFLGGVAMAAATWAAGQVAASSDPATSYGVAVAMSAISLILAVLLNRLWKGGQVA